MTTDNMDIDVVSASTSNKLTTDSDDIIDSMVKQLKELAKGNNILDSRHIWRTIKEFNQWRKESHLTQNNLTILIDTIYPDDSSYKKYLLSFINDNFKNHVNNSDEIRNSYPLSFYQVSTDDSGIANKIEVQPIINCFLHHLVQIYLFDLNKNVELNQFNCKYIIPNILEIYNNRALDLINAKLWFFTLINNEKILNNDDIEIQQSVNLRAEMIKFLKIATLKHDLETKAMLITLISRNYLNLGDINLASDFISKIDFPLGKVSSTIEARYYFYLSKINAIQLNYSAACEYIIAAIRKSSQNDKSLGFLQQVNKLYGVIQLLMGDIPELSFFHQPKMERSLYPYYHLTNTVKIGDLNKFTTVLTKFKVQLIKDGNYQLCTRLRSNVIKTGIRMISLTYKKISLKDICLKLSLDSEQTAEYMVSRAIRDGVIEASINHQDGYIETTELLNVYDTDDPQVVFDERIKFVNQLHDESVLGMRYPDDGKKKKRNDNENALDGDLLDDMSDFSDFSDLEFL